MPKVQDIFRTWLLSYVQTLLTSSKDMTLTEMMHFLPTFNYLGTTNPMYSWEDDSIRKMYRPFQKELTHNNFLIEPNLYSGNYITTYEPNQNLVTTSQNLIVLISLIKTPNFGFSWVLKLFLYKIDQ